MFKKIFGKVFHFHVWDAWETTGRYESATNGRMRIVQERVCKTCGKISMKVIDSF